MQATTIQHGRPTSPLSVPVARQIPITGHNSGTRSRSNSGSKAGRTNKNSHDSTTTTAVPTISLDTPPALVSDATAMNSGPMQQSLSTSPSCLVSEDLSIDTDSCHSHDTDSGISIASSDSFGHQSKENLNHGGFNSRKGSVDHVNSTGNGHAHGNSSGGGNGSLTAGGNRNDGDGFVHPSNDDKHKNNRNQHNQPQEKERAGNTVDNCTGSTSVHSSTSGQSLNNLSGAFKNGFGMSRSTTRHVFSEAEKSHAESQPLTLTKYFGHDVNRYTRGSPEELIVDGNLRSFIEPHIAKARNAREERRQIIFDQIGIDPRIVESMSISSNAYIPYPVLRNERPFLYDVETYPLHHILAATLGVDDLSQLHRHQIQDKRRLLEPLLDTKSRKAFHYCYDNFVTSFCIPLLHSLAMEPKIFNNSSSSRSFHHQNEPPKVCYRYQAFPCIRVVRPGEFSIGPHCDMSYGHSMGNINFHIPLTPTFGTNALYTESHPGREDWHPLKTKSAGMGFSFDGARSIHFTLENTTQQTRVSLDFRIAIYRAKRSNYSIPNSNSMMQHSIMMSQRSREIEGESEEYEIDVHDSLCNRKMLQDNYSTYPGYYEEAFVDLGAQSANRFDPGPVVQKVEQFELMHPDKRVGFPF